MAWFRKKRLTARKPANGEVRGDWAKCDGCGSIHTRPELEEALFVCPACGRHERVGASFRVRTLLDEGSFTEMWGNIRPEDPLRFADSRPYTERIEAALSKGEGNEAILTGFGTMGGTEVAFAAMNFSFMGGSMGSGVGEKLALLAEAAAERRAPLVVTTASGGARMQEGALSLMQMAKTAGAFARHKDSGALSVSILCDPTTGGTTASFAVLSEILLAEPGALIGFAGPRVIEQTIRQKLPEGFQRSEFLMEHGMIDMIVQRKDLKETVTRLLRFAGAAPPAAQGKA